MCLQYSLSAEIQSRRQERKRRTTANPVYSGAVFEPEVTMFSGSYDFEIQLCLCLI